MNQIAVCAECQRQGRREPFRVPWGDHIGPALMEEHYRQEHPEVKLK